LFEGSKSYAGKVSNHIHMRGINYNIEYIMMMVRWRTEFEALFLQHNIGYRCIFIHVHLHTTLLGTVVVVIVL